MAHAAGGPVATGRQGNLARYGRTLWAVLLFAIGVFLLAQAGGITYRANSSELGPAFWPRLWLGALLVLTAYDAWTAFHRARQGGGMPRDEAGAASLAPTPDESVPLLLAGMALVVAYVLATTLIGFMLATPLFLAGFMALGGFRRVLPLAVVALAATAVLLLLFVKVVYVSLPLGVAPFADLTVTVYQRVGLY